VTLANGSTGLTGVASASNGLVGSVAGDYLGYDGSTTGNGVHDLGNGSFAVSSKYWNGGFSSAFGRVDVVGAASGGASAPWGYSNFAGQDITVAPASITAITNTGTSVTLQASNDISINAPISTLNGTSVDANIGGAINLHAGRSVLVNASVTTDGGNLSIIANDTAAHGVVDAERASGVASVTFAGGAVIDAGTGVVSIRVANGAGNTNSTAGTITLGAITAGQIEVVNTGGNIQASNLTANATSNGAAGGLITLEAGGANPTITLLLQVL